MATVTVYGASDDLAEIEGDFYDEFTADMYGHGRWLFSTGTQIEMFSNASGDWVLRALEVADGDEVSYGRRPSHPSDMTCTVTGDFTEVVWVLDYRAARKKI